MGRRKVREQHIAVFGESGSGKTVLLSSFYGAAQEQQYRNRTQLDIVAEDQKQGYRLQKNYLGMKDHAEVPSATRFTSTSYSFSVRLKNRGGKKIAWEMPFDALRLVWHDYPGEWFEQGTGSPEEEKRRVKAFRSLLNSDVAFLLVDAQRLLENEGCEERYLKLLLTNFRNSLLAMEDDLLSDGARLVQFPRIWVMTLSKADLVPEMDVNKFREVMLYHASGELEDLCQVLSRMIKGNKAFSFGEYYVMLSSAKFEKNRIDVEDRVGIELILPMASVMPFEKHVEWVKNLELPQKVASTLADNAKPIARILVDKLASRAGVVGSVINLVNSVMGDLLSDAAGLAGDRLKGVLDESRQKGDTMRSVLADFKIKLEEGEKNQVLLRSLQ